MNIGDLVFGFRGDGKPLEKDAKAAGLKAGETAGKAFEGSFSGRIGKMKAEFAKGGGIQGALLGGVGIGAGVAAFGVVTHAIGMVTDFLGDAGKAASDLAETQTKLTAVFPAQADAIREWAKDSATAMGISTQAALEATGTLGNFLQTMGQAPDEAADMSMAIVQLTSDLASFNNENPEDVLLALRSGLAGETEPLRKFGVDVSDAAVQAELLASGAEKVGKNFSAAQKVQARYKLIMKQTTRAQGDYNRTADGTANKQRTAAAATQNFMGKLGELINNVQNVAAALAGTAAMALTGALDAVGEAWNDLMRLIQPGIAFEQDVDKAIRAQALSLGLNSEALMAFSDQQRQWAKDAEKAAAIVEEREAIDASYLQMMGLTNASIEEQAAALKTLHDSQALSAEGATATADALTDSEKVMAAAKVMIDAFLAAGMPVPGVLTDIADTADDAGATVNDVLIPALQDFTAVAEVTKTKVWNKKHTKWHWATQVSTRLSELKTQFRDDLATINWLLDHPGGSKKTRNELVHQLGVLDRKRQQALDDKNWQAFAEAEQQIKDVRAELTKLDGQQATVTLRMNVLRAGTSIPVLGNIFGDMFKAAGGPVRRGMPYIVGERGPEWFVPDGDGHIDPNTGGGSDRLEIIVRDPDGGLARAGISTSGLATEIATRTQAIRRWRS